MCKRTRIILAIATLIIYIITSGSDGLYAFAEEPVSSESATSTTSATSATSAASTTSTKPEIISISYEPYDDTVCIDCTAETKGVWVGNLKKKTGAALTKSKFYYLPLTEYTSKTGTKRHTYIALNNKEEAWNLGISEDKDTYLYITITEPSDEKTNYTPNFIVEASPYKKIDIVLDYASVYRDDESSAISRIKVTKTDKSVIECSRTEKEDMFEELLSKLQYGYFESSDGEKEYCIEEKAYDKDAYRIVCGSAPSCIKVYVGQDFTTGKFIYSKVENDRFDWVFDYDSSWGNKRVYNYAIECDNEKLATTEISGKDNDAPEVYDVYSKDRLLYAVIYDNNDENNRYLLNETEFVYRGETEDGNKSGFYAEVGDNERNIEEYGLAISAKTGKELTEGDKVTIKVSEAITAADFGLEIKFTSENTSLNDGDTIVLVEEKSYNFSGSYLESIVEEVAGIEKDEKRKLMLAFRIEGSDSVNGKNAYRNSKIKTVKVAKPPKEQKIKFDIKKEVLSVKNGYDYRVDYSDNGKKYSSGWKTILPFNTEGTAEKAVIDIKDYYPVKKFSDNPKAYTSTKVTNIPIDEIMEGTGITVMVRKSASLSSPASVTDDGEGFCSMYISARAAAPKVAVSDKGYLSVIDSKNSFKLPTVSAADTDTAKGKKEFEYAVISKADFEKSGKLSDNIDFSTLKWNKYVKGKKITVGKTKSKYKRAGEEGAQDHILEVGDYIIIRRKGFAVKSDGIAKPTLASNYLVTYISEETIDSSKKTVWRILSDQDEAASSALDDVAGNSGSSSGESTEGNTSVSGEPVEGSTSTSGEPVTGNTSTSGESA